MDNKPQANQRQADVSEVELATLTGFFAGEGTISCASMKHYFTVYASLGNSERCWVKRFHELFGGSFYVETPKYLGAKHMFRWRVNGELVSPFLRAIQPYLKGEKAQQLEIALKMQDSKDAYGKGLNHGFPAQLIVKLDMLHREMQNIRRAAAETNRKDATPLRSDSPTLVETPVSVTGENSPSCQLV